ncbi:MAG: hypothetical protein JF588_15785 [Caulobacterales bacterium]|nr:hypothetical protein [Caulobacterales bacterium]
MARLRLIIACLAAAPVLASAGAAVAGEAACWFEGGVVVVPAEVAGIAGDYILDTGTAVTTLHDTAAGGAGLDGETAVGAVRLAGLRQDGRSLKIASIDARTWNLPTAVAGVIGTDLLRGYVVDVEFSPCRVRLSEPGRAPAFRGRALPLAWDLDRPVAEASVSDGGRTLTGPFVIATGANVPVRLADDLAQAPDAAKPDELYPKGVWMARLPVLRFAGAEARDLGAGLMKPEGEAAGVIGGPALAGYRLRFDFPAGRLVVAPAR